MEIKTEIMSNGSKWAGEEPDSIETLLGVIDAHVLDQAHFFDGQFIHHYPGEIFFFGNFEDVSHVFSIATNDPEIIREMTTRIARNVIKNRPYFESRKPNKPKEVLS